ncbi:hypothetical protein FHE72_20475 [Rossellomorea vietnamensis]|uniref:Uncharacterized protein n=1 Tax=Rossellomorea vietnamensis TaxID=218284 RepID=A0A6I6UP12_9BACI|nr:hypothetical protein [Rossellomorea vietnamensis]QHE63117.1 hypothetical protein FHE72_20475 [Rossellomorea vietnamensis]
MKITLNNPTDTVEEEIQERLFSMRKNWHLLKPFLNDEEVQTVLNNAMTAFCEEHPPYGGKMWVPGDAPWEYTTSAYWCDRITDKVNEDEEYQKEVKLLNEEWIEKTNLDEDDLWDDDEYREQHWARLYETYYDKHSPKEGTIEWYKFIHGCHWINQFTAALVSKALNVEAYVWQTETHTCATFLKDNIIYFADVQLEWENLDELLDFMGEEVDYYPIFESK